MTTTDLEGQCSGILQAKLTYTCISRHKYDLSSQSDLSSILVKGWIDKNRTTFNQLYNVVLC